MHKRSVTLNSKELKMYSIKKVIMRRDGLTEDEADDLIAEAREMVANGENPERVLRIEFGLEPDYVFDLL